METGEKRIENEHSSQLKISYCPHASYSYAICSILFCREESFLYILSILCSQLDPLQWCDNCTLPFKSSAMLQHTIADHFVPEKYPNYGNFMMCNNVKRLTSNNYIEEEGEFKHQFTGLLVPATKLTALYIFYTSLS